MNLIKKSIAGVGVVVFAVMLVCRNDSYAQVALPKAINVEEYMLKKTAIYTVLKRYNSPLLTEVDAFMNACITYNIDCYLLPSISGIESTFGQQMIASTHNPFGWGGGLIAFNSWSESFNAIAKGLRYNYINKGADTIEKIGYIYCPPNATWSTKVHFFRNQFLKAEKESPLNAARF